ncbi:MAG: hypothetical protein ACI4HO_02465 [Ruminococcus sp.]
MKTFCLRIKKFCTTQNHRYVNGTKGVISIFLACMMLPFAYMADLMVESGRYNEAMSLAEQSVANAEMSTLSDYDEYLLERFGLLAVSQENDYDIVIRNYLDKCYKDMASSLNISVDAVKGLLALNGDEILLRQIEESSKYSLPSYYAGNTVNKLLETIKDCKLGKQFDFLFEVLGSAGNISNSIVELFNSFKTFYNTTEDLEKNISNYKSSYESFISAAENLVTKKADYEAAVSDYNSKSSTANRSKQNLLDCENLINAYINGVNDSDLSDETKTKIVDYISDILDRPSKSSLYSDLKTYIKDNIEKNAEFKYIYKSKESSIRFWDLSDSIKDLDYSGKKHSNYTANTELSNASSDLQKAESKIQPTINEFNSAKSDYIEKINVLIAGSTSEGSLKKYSSELSDLISKTKEVGKSFAEAAQKNATNFQTFFDSDKKGWKDEISVLEKEKKGANDEDKIKEYDEKISDLNTKINDQETLYRNIQAGVDKGAETYDAFMDNASSKELFSEAMVNIANEACNKLIEIKTNVNNLKASDINSKTNIRSQKSRYYYDLSQSYSGTKIVGEVIKVFWDRIKQFDKVFKKVKAAIAVLESVFADGGFYNSNLTAYIKEGFVGESDFEQLAFDISDFLNAADNLNLGGTNAANLIDNIIHPLARINKIIHFFDNLKTLFECGRRLVNSLSSFVGDVVNNFSASIKDMTSGKLASKLVLSLYLLNSLPNRTNYDTGKSEITGMKYTDIARTDRDFEGTLQPFEMKKLRTVISSIREQEASDYVFSGAELEYILIGGRSEIINQMGTFFQIYALRFLINIAPVFLNEFVQELASELGSCTFGIGTVIVYVVYLLAEPYLDTTLLAMGNKQAIIKRPSKLYLTPEGLPDLLKEFTKVSLNSETKKKIKEEGAKIFDKNSSEITESPRTEEDNNDVQNKGNNKSVLDSIKAQYSTYLFLFIYVEHPEELILERYKNLISLESKEYYRGKGKTFELAKAYTYLQVDATAYFSPILPLEPLSYSAFNKIDIQQCRGY